MIVLKPQKPKYNNCLVFEGFKQVHFLMSQKSGMNDIYQFHFEQVQQIKAERMEGRSSSDNQTLC